MTEMMIPNNEKIWGAIAASINGNATIEQNKMVESWLSEDTRNQKFFKHLKSTGYTGSIEKALQAKEKIIGNVQQRINQSQNHKIVRLWQYVAAASITLLLAVSSIYFISNNRNSDNALVESNTPKGVRSKIVLSDGTLVNLNTGSTLSYPSTFKGKERRVILNGEAYFEVVKDQKHPFLVSAGGINVKVLGTHFNVKAYTNNGEVITSLIEGSVSIKKQGYNDDEIILRPNQQAIYDRKKESVSVHDVKAKLFASWTEGGYYFGSEPLEEIVHCLERGFNIPIKIQSEKLKEEVFSGIFDREESLRQILDIMKMHRDFDYKINADSVMLFKN